MNRRDIENLLYRKLEGYTHDECQKIMAVVIEAVAEAIAAGEVARIRGLGAWHPRERKPRRTRNPLTGDVYLVTNRKTVVFYPDSNLRKLINPEGLKREKLS